MGLTEEIRSQLFGMGALGRRRAINELRSSEDKYARSLVPCWRMWWLAHARSRTVEGADLHHERCLSQIIISFAPQIINRPLKLKVVKDNNFNYGQWKELPEECQNNKAESGTCSC